MEILKLLYESDQYQAIWPKNGNIEIFNTDGRSVRDRWDPIEMKFQNKKKKRGDCPSFIFSVPVFSENAIRALDDLIKKDVEYLDLVCPGPIQYWVVNVLPVIDCIDYSKAIPYKFPDGRIIDFERYAFRFEKIIDIAIFKIYNLLNNPVFVTDKFRDRVLESNLQGFVFEKAT